METGLRLRAGLVTSWIRKSRTSLQGEPDMAWRISGWSRDSRLLAPLRLPKPKVAERTASTLRTTARGTGLATPLLATRTCTTTRMPGRRSLTSASSGSRSAGSAMEALVLVQSWG
ncbi:hypothetical protein D3C84_639550 [compost metagenome]